MKKSIIFATIAAFLVLMSTIGFSWDSGWGDGWDDGWGDSWDDGWGDGWDDGWGDGWDDGHGDGWDDGHGDGWDDGHGDGWDDGSGDDDGDGSEDDLTDDEDDDDDDGFIDHPPYWQTLDPQSILEDSPDGTLVYYDIASECVDSDGDPTTVSIFAHAPAYELYMVGGSIFVRDLTPDYFDNGRIVTMLCGDTLGFFRLTVVPVRDDLGPEIVNLTVIDVDLHGPVKVIDLINHEYDPDNTHDELSWSIIGVESTTHSEVTINGKEMRVKPKIKGESRIRVRLEDPDGNFDEETVLIRVNKKQPTGSSEEDDKSDAGIFISSIRFLGDGIAEGGDIVEAYVSVKNKGTRDLDDAKIRLVIQDLGVMGTVGPFDIEGKETITKRVLVDVYEDIEITEDVYDVRVTISNDYERRVVHREVDVELV